MIKAAEDLPGLMKRFIWTQPILLRRGYDVEVRRTRFTWGPNGGMNTEKWASSTGWFSRRVMEDVGCLLFLLFPLFACLRTSKNVFSGCCDPPETWAELAHRIGYVVGSVKW